jgi:hypothetical protein
LKKVWDGEAWIFNKVTVLNRLDAIDWPDQVSRPSFETDYDAIEVTDETAGQLSVSHGIRINNKGHANTILLSRGFRPLVRQVNIGFNGSNNICLIEEGTGLQGAITCHSNCVAVILGGQKSLTLNATLYHGGQLFWGRGARTFGCRIWTHGGKRVVVGDDCLFSEGITIRTSDHHSIVELDGFTQINHPADVIIGRHVWVSPDVQIMRGVQLGTGAIIGIGSIVTKDVPPTELWAGVPAKCLKKNVSWVNSHPAEQTHIAELRSLLEG